MVIKRRKILSGLRLNDSKNFFEIVIRLRFSVIVSDEAPIWRQLSHTKLMIQHRNYWVMWYAYAFKDIVHFQSPNGQDHIMNFFNYSDVWTLNGRQKRPALLMHVLVWQNNKIQNTTPLTIKTEMRIASCKGLTASMWPLKWIMGSSCDLRPTTQLWV